MTGANEMTGGEAPARRPCWRGVRAARPAGSRAAQIRREERIA